MRATPLLFLSLFIVTSAAGQMASNPLVGTWEMISQRQIYPDTTLDRGRFLGPSYKILNDTHFAFGRQTIIGGVVEDDVYAGGGRYEYDGQGTYTEYVEYHESAPTVGLTIKFNARLQGDSIWYHTGQIGEMLLEEVWRRVD